MANFAATYRDATHTYRLSGRAIIMRGADGLEHQFTRDTPDQARAMEDLEKIRPFEPNLVKAAWHVFGDSYRYRQKYNEYKAQRRSDKNGGKRNERN